MSRTTFLGSHAFLACAAVSHADVVTLDLNALKIGEEVLDSYDGGFGSLGSGPGPNIGITFSNDFVTMASGVFGPPFRAEELTSTRGILDIPAGYSGIFSFYFKNSGAFGNVFLCSGLDAVGCTLGQLGLSPLPTFGAAGLLLTVPAHSVVIFGDANALVLDDITEGAFVPPPGSAVPEPTSVVLLISLLTALCMVLRRRNVRSATQLSRSGQS